MKEQAEPERLQQENSQLRQALIDADATARERGDKYGLCDQLDNNGCAYPSSWMECILDYVKEQGVLPTRTVEEALQVEAWNQFKENNR